MHEVVMFGQGLVIPSLLFLIQLTTLSLAAQTCYFPNGAVAIHDVPCNDTSVSICCQTVSTCLNDGLCFNPLGSAVGGFIRGSCTDKSFTSSLCPLFCNTDDNVAGIINTISDAGVLSCGNSHFCCESASLSECNCQTGNGTFTLAGNILPFTSIPSSIPQSSISTSPLLSSSSSATSISTTTSSSSTNLNYGSPSASAPATTSQVPNLSSSANPTTISPLAGTNSSASPSATSIQVSSSSQEVIIGLEVGIPVGAAVFGAIRAFGAWLSRRHRRTSKDSSTMLPSTSDDLPYSRQMLDSTQISGMSTKPGSKPEWTPNYTQVKELPTVPDPNGSNQRATEPPGTPRYELY
ncbi:uncharacterized protein LY89DRAFT_727197 [Mollisia scopiformis]|uniref:Uncharacterized protein n=1 Tax=Mollisia scopiformis TaxID=149040 RepID=A0A194XWQ6_MOLSC|nr:uncharacterized protein LY89DRAFT_727197 [Mollisia scopiformis]KUJ24162.1 hypothetical protein LY89DRAFT_727197 [Mollisia scopiformis]